MHLSLTATIAATLLTACVDDTENRQFANDPRTPQPTATHRPVQNLDVSPPSAPMPVGSPEALVDRRGAPDTVYLGAGGELWVIEENAISSVATGPILDVAMSPSGHLAAIATTGEEGIDVVVLHPDGSVEQSFSDVIPHQAIATPAEDSRDEAVVSLSWSPLGGRLLLTHSDGHLLDVDLAGTVKPIDAMTSLGGIERAYWSPRGDQIATILRDADGFGRLALIEPSDDGASRVNVIAPVGQVNGDPVSVEEVGWKPHGDGVLYLQGRRSGDDLRNGQVVSWDQASNTTQVMATGGQAGPTGTIRSFSVAPDGKAFAYTIDIPMMDRREFGGLYVRSLQTGQVYRVPVAPDASVGAFWWLGDGLAWEAITGESEDPRVDIRWVDATGEITTIGTIAEPAAATPAASPVVASPVPDGTPAVTPLGRPVASPVASPSPEPQG